MNTLQTLMANTVRDQRNNITHFIVGDVLYATYLPQIKIMGKVNIDMSTENIKIIDEVQISCEHNPIVVIYNKPVHLPTSIQRWNMHPDATFWVTGVINGLGFVGNFVPSSGWSTPQILDLYSSNFDSMVDSSQSDPGKLARSLLLYMTNQKWDFGFISRQIAAQNETFMANLWG